mmetsp:Transcript_15707/g.21251  ORF Transcript_15707/g.21251 Transcript_15707/m.21251 type:complete len:101 (-) Transcript_15707:56-358(-)
MICSNIVPISASEIMIIGGSAHNQLQGDLSFIKLNTETKAVSGRTTLPKKALSQQEVRIKELFYSPHKGKLVFSFEDTHAQLRLIEYTPTRNSVTELKPV